MEQQQAQREEATIEEVVARVIALLTQIRTAAVWILVILVAVFIFSILMASGEMSLNVEGGL